MRGIGARAAALLLLVLLAGACDPGTPFVAASGHPGKRGIDGGTDAGEPPPPPPPSALATLTIVIEGTGRVFSPPWFDCSSTCAVQVPARIALDVHSEGERGHAFLRWDGACTGAGRCVLELDGDAPLVAVFGAAR